MVGQEEEWIIGAVPVRSLDEEAALASDAMGESESIDSYVEPSVKCEFVTGSAGSGKTYSCIQAIANDPAWGALASTTGISAVNLGTITINSLLKFFDTASLRDSYLQGHLARRIFDLRKEYRRLVIDEISMMDGDQLSLIVRAAMEANSWKSDQPPIAILVTGDFCQLPPVKAKWAFESDEWWRFRDNTTRLTKIWRQTDAAFLNALNFARAGNGVTSADILSSEGLEWHSALDIEFDGTTIVSKNDAVGRYNSEALSRLPGQAWLIQNRRWGKQRSEWGQRKGSMEWGIPPSAQFKDGAYVMLLANKYDEDGLLYANGDCGHIVEHSDYDVTVRLVRTGEEVSVSRLIRAVDVGAKDRPADWKDRPRGMGEWLASPHWRTDSQKWVEGQIQFWPMRLAYASTVHKSQGISLDRCQIDCRDHFFSSPGMMYVGLSRVRTLQGLRMVGQKERFVRQVNTDPRVTQWL